jgi:hypothetical protein
MTRITLPLDDETYQRLRRIAGQNRTRAGRASISGVVVRLIQERLICEGTDRKQPAGQVA